MSLKRRGKLVSIAPAMHMVFAAMDAVARTDAPVLIIGERGTGKRLAARALHEQSGRAGGLLVSLPCRDTPAAALAGVAGPGGAFERALGGTLVLEEISALETSAQQVVLAAVRSARRQGGPGPRLIATATFAANDEGGLFTLIPELQALFGEGLVHLPALRERMQDAPLLIADLLDELGGRTVRIGPGVHQALRTHPWPGNVSELRRTIVAALEQRGGASLEVQHLHIPMPEVATLERLPLGGQSLAEIERVAIKQTLVRTGGNKVKAAHALGIAVSTLYEKFKKYGV